MTGEELQRRLDGRPYAWLGELLGVPRLTAWRWAHDEQVIPEDQARAIRERLPLPNEEVQGDGCK